MMADLPTHWPWPISIDRIYVGGAGREAEKGNRTAGNLHVDAFRLALEADGWLIEPTYGHEAVERAWRAERDGFVIGGLSRPNDDKTLGTPQIDGWCDRGISLHPIPLAYPGFDAIKALAHYCPECKRDGVETVRVAFANRACRDCEPALRAKLETPGWCD